MATCHNSMSINNAVLFFYDEDVQIIKNSTLCKGIYATNSKQIMPMPYYFMYHTGLSNCLSSD